MAAAFLCAIPLGEICILVRRTTGALEEPGISLPPRTVKIIKMVEVAMGGIQALMSAAAVAIIYGAYRGDIAIPAFPEGYYQPLLLILGIALSFFALAGMMNGYSLVKRRYVLPRPELKAQGT